MRSNGYYFLLPIRLLLLLLVSELAEERPRTRARDYRYYLVFTIATMTIMHADVIIIIIILLLAVYHPTRTAFVGLCCRHMVGNNAMAGHFASRAWNDAETAECMERLL